MTKRHTGMAVFYISGEEPTSTPPHPITNHAKCLYTLYWDNKPNLLLLAVLKVHSGENLVIQEMIAGQGLPMG